MSDQKRRYSPFPRQMAQVVEPLTKPLFKSRGLAGTNAINDWSKIAGKELAGHCWPEKITFPHGKKTGGTLTVACENGFATEIQHMQPMILERLNVFYGYQAVTKLTISHSIKKTSHSSLFSTPTEKNSKNFINQGINYRNHATNVSDPELMQALYDLAATLEKKI